MGVKEACCAEPHRRYTLRHTFLIRRHLKVSQKVEKCLKNVFEGKYEMPNIVGWTKVFCGTRKNCPEMLVLQAL